MNVNAQKWVEALRSDKYKQARNGLHRVGPWSEGFCCLGVACDLYQREVGDLHVDSLETGWKQYDGNSGMLPPKVQLWLGLTTSDGEFTVNDVPSALTTINDNGGKFSEIADLIESEPEGLFGEPEGLFVA